jgi:membrane-associated phospholipid phosphatase
VAARLKTIYASRPVDLVKQFAILLAVYYAYRLTRGYIDGPQGAAIAFDNARDLISLEQSMGLYFEPALHEFFREIEPLKDFANLLYMNAQTSVVLTGLLFLYFAHNARFYFVRNMFLVSMGLALVGYVIFPTAPPRFFFAEYGFQDTVSQAVGADETSSVNALFNPYAAVPSMHCAFAMMLGFTFMKIGKHRITRILWGIYPLVMFWCVVVTANHWWLDAAFGAATAALSAYAALWLARARPTVWAFSPAKATASVSA